MQRKHIILTLVIAAVFIMGIILGFMLLPIKGMGIHTGKILRSTNGTCFLITENSPVRLTDLSDEKERFSSYKDGDTVLILHNGIAESYPASTAVYFSVKLKNGSASEIPEDVIASLKDLGWIEAEEDSTAENTDITGERIKKGNENANFSLILPEGWKYEDSNTLQEDSFGISIYREDSPDETITIGFYSMFGVCGTGLRTESITLGGFKAHKGIYDGNPTFDYIIFEDTPGYYVINNNCDSEWWKENKSTAMSILDSVIIADGIIFREEAVSKASEFSVGEYKRKVSEYDHKNGIWTITFMKEETEQVVKLNKKGEKIS